MTKTYTNTTAETSTAEQTGQNLLELKTSELELLGWAMSVVITTLAAQEGRSIPEKESAALINAIANLDQRIHEQIPPQKPDSGYEQLTLF